MFLLIPFLRLLLCFIEVKYHKIKVKQIFPRSINVPLSSSKIYCDKVSVQQKILGSLLEFRFIFRCTFPKEKGSASSNSVNQ